MATIDNQPTNPAFLSPLGYKLTIKKTPQTVYYVQSVNIPSVSLGTADAETPFVKLPFPGTKLTYGNLAVTFKLDEDMNNYLELYAWMRSLGFPDNFSQYQNIAGQSIVSGEGIYSDITLTVLSSAMNPNINITFYDCFPIDISEVSFDSTSEDVNYLTATVSFANRRFDIERIV
jgi:hypothetical protein